MLATLCRVLRDDCVATSCGPLLQSAFVQFHFAPLGFYPLAVDGHLITFAMVDGTVADYGEAATGPLGVSPAFVSWEGE